MRPDSTTSAAAAPGLYTIPAGADFLGAIAARLLAEAEAQGTPRDLGAMRIFLPTRRAASVLEQRLLHLSGADALLLPRITPLGSAGDPEEADELMQGDHDPHSKAIAKPVLSNARRQFHLTRLILHWDSRPGVRIAGSPAQAALLARELGSLLDSAETEKVDLNRLHDIAPEIYAENWQKTLQFLHIIVEQWPRHLAQTGCISATARRDAGLRAIAAQWRRQPPQHLVIAAGSTGSIPATAELLACIASLPRGMVVLPGLDSDMPEDLWQAAGWEHPQYAMKRLLETFKIPRSQVRLWQDGLPPETPAAAARLHLLRLAFCPAEQINHWQSALAAPDCAAVAKSALDGLNLIEAPGRREEAGMIATLLREQLETPAARAALVTPDRELALWVSGEMRRWGIEIDDSAGGRLRDSDAMRLALLLGEAVAGRLAPASLLALLKSPLARLDMPPARLHLGVNLLERFLLRGLAPSAGVAGLRAALTQAKKHPHPGSRPAPKQAKQIKFLIDALDAALKPLLSAAQRKCRLEDWLQAHISALEAFTAERGGSNIPDKQKFYDFFSALHEDASDSLPPLALRDYLDLLAQLAASHSMPAPAWKTHPRLSIWGLPEARLQSLDLVVLGGLNEGVWPARSETGPWLNRNMMNQLGLRDPQWRIGHSAHDFVQCAMQPNVVLSRAVKVDGAPTMKSRWLLRLETLLRGMGIETIGEAHFSDHLLARFRALDSETPDAIPAPVKPPMPRPPVPSRPRTLSVTAIERLIDDPYGVFARHILHLRPLDPLQAEFDARLRGSLLHNILDDFCRAYPQALPPDIAAVFLETAARRLKPLEKSHPEITALLRPSLQVLARRFAAFERSRRSPGTKLLVEAEGKLTLSIDGVEHRLTCFADRIEIAADGAATLCEYKSGTLPDNRDVISGKRPQLPLEAVIFEAGGFADCAGKELRLDGLTHISARGREGLLEELQWREICDKGPTLPELVAQTKAGLEQILSRYLAAETPYISRPWRAGQNHSGDYDHLARLLEWSSAADEETGS